VQASGSQGSAVRGFAGKGGVVVGLFPEPELEGRRLSRMFGRVELARGVELGGVKLGRTGF
jgi:hypothetical protein